MHKVYQIDGEDSMAFVGELPWHGLGNALDPDMPLEIWMKKAHMDWTVERSPVRYNLPLGFRDSMISIQMDNRHVLYRSDNMAPLSVVSNRFKIVQPEEILEFYRDLVDQHDFKMETAGTLDEGRRVWALAKTGKDCRIMGQDKIEGYLLLMTAYDASLATTAKFTTVRVVCNNTLEMAVDSTMQDKAGRFLQVKVPHGANFDATKVKFDLGLVNEVWSKMVDRVYQMASQRVSMDAAIKFFATLYQSNYMEKPVIEEVNMPKVDTLIQAYIDGPGATYASSKGTIWGLMNAVSYMTDHEHNARNANNRFKYATMAGGAALKRKAWIAADNLTSELMAA
jgi:phage/plasmid-like protein (TIGR03299 family)